MTHFNLFFLNGMIQLSLINFFIHMIQLSLLGEIVLISSCESEKLGRSKIKFNRANYFAANFHMLRQKLTEHMKISSEINRFFRTFIYL